MVRAPSADERAEWVDLKRQEASVRARRKVLEGFVRLSFNERRELKELRRQLDTIMAAQREIAMDFWLASLRSS